MVASNKCRIDVYRRMCASLCVFLLLAGGGLASLGQAKEKDDAPEQIIQWTCSGYWDMNVGACGGSIYAISVDPKVFDVWQWDVHGMKKSSFTYTLPGNYTSGHLPIGVLSDNKWILGAADIDVLAGKTHLYSGDLQSGKVTKRWDESK